MNKKMKYGIIGFSCLAIIGYVLGLGGSIVASSILWIGLIGLAVLAIKYRMGIRKNQTSN